MLKNRSNITTINVFTLFSYRHHMNIHTGTRNQLCKYCGKSFTDTANRRMHERTVHEGFKRSEKNKGGSPANSSLPKCNNCGKVFSRYDKLNNHIKNVHEEQNNIVLTNSENNSEHTCNLCNMVLSRGDKLKNHMKNVHEEGKDAVTEATSITTKPKSYHEKEIVCIHCNMVVSRAYTLKKHLKNVHKIMTKGLQRKNVHEGQNQEEKEDGKLDEYNNESTKKLENLVEEKILTPPDSPTVSTT